ncbi:SAM-dependent methyltransferase [Amycolatopsis sp. NPDC051071]|uniref:SAM-dependent methyltransferase n=1 Tax=Amycolatopsis sp. NPDC051071 TaxID=3154637 RepID=UPI0034381B3E
MAWPGASRHERSVDPERLSVARAHNYFLGGSFNTPVDRAFAEHVLEILPASKTMALDNRNFLSRAIAYLIENGVRQFIDIGSGIPTAGKVHHIARALSPDVTVVYADNDPVAVAQSKLLLRDDPATVAIDADLRHSADILDNATVRGHHDFSQPIGLLMIAVLHFIPDHDDPAAYRDALPPASYIALSHLIDETAHPTSTARSAAASTPTRAAPARWSPEPAAPSPTG